MGKVVDHNFRVIGIDALRVVDGSIFTLSLGTNGHPPVDSGSASIFRQQSLVGGVGVVHGVEEGVICCFSVLVYFSV
jgi:hypothetical protein